MPSADVLTSSTSGQASVALGAKLVTQIARIVGGESENEIRAQALDCLNRVRIELNQHDWRFVKTTQSPITLSNGTATYSLDAAFRKPGYARLINTSAQAYKYLEYEDDVVFARRVEQQTESGEPSWYTLRNDYEDGLISLYPIPNLSAATDYRLEVEYYARIAGFADDIESGQALPEEVTNTLIIGGQAYILRERLKDSPIGMQAFADYQRCKTLLTTHDRRFTEARSRFRPRYGRATFGPLYIKVT